MLIDEVQIKVIAGKGGDGAVSFRRNAQTAKGGPDGGNGGHGGSVYLSGVDDIMALAQFQFKKTIKAEDGIPGKKKNLYGKNALNSTIKVPLGTQVTDMDSGWTFEVLNTSEPMLIARGGEGGLGNNEFKTATNRTPTFAEKGKLGEEKNLSLILKLIADVGLVGLPNAGKSSILKELTNAQPKIANYPFTTLEPNLGMLNRITIADIPGLIENASAGKGLGSKFLKHIEKTKIIIHVISLENESTKKAYNLVNAELDKYNPALLARTKIILLTKTDLVSNDELKTKLSELYSESQEIVPFSIYNPDDIQYLKDLISKNLVG